MRTFIQMLGAYSAWLCKAFSVTPEFITKDRRGNLPPPTGGLAAY